MEKEQVEIIDVEAKGVLGKPGTFCHLANFGCLMLLILFAVCCVWSRLGGVS